MKKEPVIPVVMNTVIFGSVGTVYTGTAWREAARCFQDATKTSKYSDGPGSGESVEWLRDEDGEIMVVKKFVGFYDAALKEMSKQ
jgi:hypothetical protein